MSNILEERLKVYNAETSEGEFDALREILQEVILSGLSDTDFFNLAVFQGGTCLRLVHGLRRFSEDLDFVMLAAQPRFDWSTYEKKITTRCNLYGFEPEFLNKENQTKSVKKMLVKQGSLSDLVSFTHTQDPRRIIRIRLDIDVNPPSGLSSETSFLDFPLPYRLQIPTINCSFAGKCHALLCRQYTKGRDLFDFQWFVSKHVEPDLEYLENTLIQSGPWEDSDINVTPSWLKFALIERISSLDWNAAKDDILRFLHEREAETVLLWSREFFLSRIEKLFTYSSNDR
jgi:predicted nucleotidyltransferase component of viral defense system